MSVADINTYPRGLLGFLDAKSNGKTPTGLADDVRMVLDAFPYYLAQREEAIASSSIAVAAVGPIFPTVDFDVPPGELWYVDHFGLISSATLAAGETLGVQMSLRQKTVAGQDRDHLLSDQLAAGSATGTSVTARAARPFMAMPGNSLGAFVYNRTVFAGTLAFRAAIIRISI